MNCPYCNKSCEIGKHNGFFVYCTSCQYSSPKASKPKYAIDKHEILYNHSRLWNVITTVLKMPEDKFQRLILKCEPFIGKKKELEDILNFIEDE